MLEDGIVLKGNREGLNIIINMDKFKDFMDMKETLLAKMNKAKRFYKGSTIKIVTEMRLFTEKDVSSLKDILFDEFLIKDCIFEDKEDKNQRMFMGVYEGRTKFLRKTIRSGQCINYPGNLVIVGDVNPGAEIYAGGNVVVLGSLRGQVYAGQGGNAKAIVAAFRLEPSILKIGDIITRAPEEEIQSSYPEVARVKDDKIIVEPYLLNKYI